MFVANVLKVVVTFSVLILVHEWGHFIAARKAGVRVETFSLGFGKRLCCLRRGQTDFVLCLFPVGGYVKLAGDNLEEWKKQPGDYLSAPIHKRLMIIAAGPLMNALLGIGFLWCVFMLGFPHWTTRVGTVLEGRGAYRAGIQKGDLITSVEGVPVLLWDDLLVQIRSHTDKNALRIGVLRGATAMELSVPLTETTVEDELKQKKRVGLIGIAPDPDSLVRKRYPPLPALQAAVKSSYGMAVTTYKALWYMVVRKISARDSLTGPVGIMHLITQTRTAVDGLHLTAILSISLMLINILPIPPLDGCHMLLLAVEKFRGKYLAKKTEEIIATIGMGLFILLAVLLVANDLDRLGLFKRILALFHRS
jgi:regulator of sigma E protease